MNLKDSAKDTVRAPGMRRAEAGSEVARELFDSLSSRDRFRTEPASSGYSIRIVGRLRPFPCRQCGRLLSTGGPTGFLGDFPVCDACLLAGDRQLGMAMTLITVCRFYGGAVPVDLEEERRLQREMLAFARVYERFAGQFGPARPWSDFLGSWTPDG